MLPSCPENETLVRKLGIETDHRFSGTNLFLNNSAGHGGSGGAMYTSDNVVISFNVTSNFINNSVDYDDGGGGGAIYASFT